MALAYVVSNDQSIAGHVYPKFILGEIIFKKKERKNNKEFKKDILIFHSTSITYILTLIRLPHQ